MKKLLTVLLSAMLLIASCFSLVACSNPDNGDDSGDPKPQTDIKYTAVDTQADALSNIQLGDADVAVVNGTFYSYFTALNSISTFNTVSQSAVNLETTDYYYATKKDSNVALYINAALYKLQQDGKLAEIAANSHITDYLKEIPKPEVTFENLPEPEAGSAWAEIKKTGYLKVAIPYDEGQKTPFLNMSQYGCPDGFDVKVCVAISQLFDLKVTGRSNSVDDVFLFNGGGEVDCNNLDHAFAKLDSGEVDIVINRVTTENAPSGAELTPAVVTDTQVIVVNGTAPSFDSLKTKKFTAGKNSICDESVKTLIKNYFFN